MDKLSFPETLTREMSEIIARNPRKYAHLTLDVELDNPDDVWIETMNDDATVVDVD